MIYWTKNGRDTYYMDEKILKFFDKHSIQIDEIKYLTRSDGKTCIHMTDGRVIKTFTTVKEFFDTLRSYDFISINKGILVSQQQIDHIDHFTYHMIDGTKLEGRKRTIAAHKTLGKAIEEASDPAVIAADIRAQFSVLDNMPVAFCVIELIFNSDNAGIDFVFRYCNEAFACLENRQVEDVIGQSFYQVFPGRDKKLVATYVDVSMNGTARQFRTYNPEIMKELLVKCFQPMENFCACMLFPTDEL